MADSTDNSLFAQAVQSVAAGKALSGPDASILIAEIFMPTIKNTFIRHPFFEEVTSLGRDDLIGELWRFCSTPDQRSNRTLWRKALEAVAARGISGTGEGSALKSYLMLCCKRHITSILMKGSAAEAMVALIGEACRQNKGLQLSVPPEGTYFATIHPVVESEACELSELTLADLEDLLPRLSIPVPKSRRQTLSGAALPTPTQVLDLVNQILTLRQGTLSVRNLVDWLFTAFNIPRQAVNVSLDGDSDDSDAERSPGRPYGDELKNISVAPAHHHAEKEALIPGYARALMEKITQADKVPVLDVDPSSGGKIAKVFLDFVLWQGAVRDDDPSVRFGYEVYAEMTGTPVSTVNDRYIRKFVPLLETFSNEHQLSAADVKAMFAHLRKQYSARKPENFGDPASTYQ